MILLVLSQWIIKQDYTNKYLVTGDLNLFDTTEKKSGNVGQILGEQQIEVH